MECTTQLVFQYWRLVFSHHLNYFKVALLSPTSILHVSASFLPFLRLYTKLDVWSRHLVRSNLDAPLVQFQTINMQCQLTTVSRPPMLLGLLWPSCGVVPESKNDAHQCSRPIFLFSHFLKFFHPVGQLVPLQSAPIYIPYLHSTSTHVNI